MADVAIRNRDPYGNRARTEVTTRKAKSMNIIDRLRRGMPSVMAMRVAATELEGLYDVLEDHRRLVRELDAALNGAGAAPQASLGDIVSQVKAEGIKSPKFKPI